MLHPGFWGKTGKPQSGYGGERGTGGAWDPWEEGSSGGRGIPLYNLGEGLDTLKGRLTVLRGDQNRSTLQVSSVTAGWTKLSGYGLWPGGFSFKVSQCDTITSFLRKPNGSSQQQGFLRPPVIE